LSFLFSTEQACFTQVDTPRRGKSHHWAKNQTAKKPITNKISFMFHAPCVVSTQVPIDESCQLTPRDHPDLTLPHLPVLDEE
jgi:hypothetical protein